MRLSCLLPVEGMRQPSRYDRPDPATHDPMEILFAFVKDTVMASTTSAFRDAITLTFTLPPTTDNVSGVFALVNKGALQYTRMVDSISRLPKSTTRIAPSPRAVSPNSGLS